VNSRIIVALSTNERAESIRLNLSTEPSEPLNPSAYPATQPPKPNHGKETPVTTKQAAFLKHPSTDLPDQDYDLANIIAASRAVERAESNLATFKKHQRLHLLGWGLVALTLAGAIYELIRW
jgi:hypothetical protein